MGSIISAILGYIVKGAFDALLTMLREKRSEQTQREVGSLQSSTETQGVIIDVADKQSQNNVRDADVSDIANELQSEADRAEGSNDRKGK